MVICLPQSLDRSTPDRPGRKVKFTGDNAFHRTVRARVDEHFRVTGARKRDCPQMYLKSAIILVVFAASWTLLVLVASTWWQALPLATLLALAIAAIGFNIEHDGGHNAFSSRRWVNRVAALTLDLVGGSSYVWRQKHAVLHHGFANIKGHDTDIELGGLGRLSPYTPHRWYYRWQHFYLWPLYCVAITKWHAYDDFRDVLLGRMGEHPMKRPRGAALWLFVAGKVVFFSLALVIPLLLHPPGVVLAWYAYVFALVGLLLSVVFQLAHCVEPASFSIPADDGSIASDWARHQVASTVNFARGNRLATWYLGGLNYQIEHHLFPTICHTNYPHMAPVVREVCAEFGIPYKEFPTFRAGIASHFRWLRQMGTAPA